MNGREITVSELSKIFSPAISDLTEADRTIVKIFFAKMLKIFGAGKYTSVFGTDDKSAMREWANIICKHEPEYLRDCLDYAQETVGPDTFPCINTILAGRPKPVKCSMYEPVPDEALPIPRSIPNSQMFMKKLTPRDSRGYPLKDKRPKAPLVSNEEFARRRAFQLEQVERMLANDKT